MARRILVADDSVTIRKVVELTFSDEDVQITAVGDGLQALESARAARPDIVISDVFMPGLDGYELCERMKADASLRSVPFLLLKGAFARFDEERARACGADGVIVKPFEAREMVTKVKELIEAAATAPVPPIEASVPPPVPAVAAAAVAPALPAEPPRSAPAAPPRPSAPPPTPAAAPAASPPRVPPPPPPPARPVTTAPSPAALFADEDFDLAPPEPAAPSAAGADDDLWSEVNLRGGAAPVADAVVGEDNFWGSLADEAVPERKMPPVASAAPPAAPPEAPPVVASPPAPAMPAAPPAPAVDAAEIERIVAARLEAAVRQALEPLVGGMARPILEEIAWQVIPELAEAMIKSEIERIARSAGSG
jgi:CheY-like chemotaxis protein